MGMLMSMFMGMIMSMFMGVSVIFGVSRERQGCPGGDGEGIDLDTMPLARRSGRGRVWRASSFLPPLSG